MEPFIIGILCLLAFLLFMFLGLPVPYSMIIVGVVGFAFIRNPTAASALVVGDLFAQFSSYTLSVAPLFALMGFVATYGGIGEKLFMVANKYIGHLRGGLAMATQVACAAFGAINGSVPATIGTMSAAAYPEMKKRGYSPVLSTVSIASGSMLSVMIPPSLTLIILGAATETSIGRLFIAGICPGLLLMILNMLACWYTVKRNPKIAPITPKSTWTERWDATKSGGIIEVAIVFFLSIGGLFLGWFTPTEAGAVGAAGMILICILERKISFINIRKALYDTTRLSTTTYVLLAGSVVYGRVIAASNIPGALGDFIAGLSMPVWAIVLIILGVYFILGMMTDIMSMILLTIPFIFPLITGDFNLDPVWWNIVILLIMGCGGITPPVGVFIFMTKGSIRDSSVSLSQVFSGVWPFVIANIVCLLLILVFPDIVTWLPNLLYNT